MKTLITLLLVSSAARSQVSTDIGFITRGAITLGVNYQKCFSRKESAIGIYSMAGTSVAWDNWLPTSSIQVGIGTNKYCGEPGWLHGNIILSAGVFLHTGIWTDDTDHEKLVRKTKTLIGGTLEYQHYQRMPLKISWDGKTTHITVGFLFFKSKCN